ANAASPADDRLSRARSRRARRYPDQRRPAARLIGIDRFDGAGQHSPQTRRRDAHADPGRQGPAQGHGYGRSHVRDRAPSRQASEMIQTLCWVLVATLLWVAAWTRRSSSARHALLLLGSYVFYAAWGIGFLAVLVASSLLNYGCGLALR